jgi:hypothetical protein
MSSQQIRWYFDGHQFCSVRESRVGAAAWRTAFDHGLAIILDLAVRRRIPGGRLTFPAEIRPGRGYRASVVKGRVA